MIFETENAELKVQMADKLYREIATSANTDDNPIYICCMLKTTDGDAFETIRSLEQNLTFDAARNAFLRYKVDFSPEKYLALGMVSPNDGLFTNLALLLSDQCRHTTKVAVFGDAANLTFKDNREFGGSLFRQLDEVFQYLSLCNRTSAVFQGLERIEKQDYPPDALREALLNALVHREYSFSGSIIINVNDAGMEIISLGGLLSGLSTEDIRSGISQPRNRNLAEVFHRLRLIEAYGTGIRKIYHLYEDCPAQPQIEVTPNTFKIVLPNMNYASPPEAEKETETVPAWKTASQMRQVLDYLRKNGEMSEEDVQKLLGVKRTRGYTLVRQMEENGLVKLKGRGKMRRIFPE